MTNKQLRDDNIKKYGLICMAGFDISIENPLTMHHIIWRCDGGQTNEQNSSNISSLPHSGIHAVSEDNKKRKKEIIEYLFYFKLHPDIDSSKQFSKWLQNELYQLEYEEYMTANKTLIYKRRK